jgi:hypothetical protein
VKHPFLVLGSSIVALRSLTGGPNHNGIDPEGTQYLVPNPFRCVSVKLHLRIPEPVPLCGQNPRQECFLVAHIVQLDMNRSTSDVVNRGFESSVS